MLRNNRVKDDEILTEGRRSVSSTKALTRFQSQWEKDDIKDDASESEADLVLEARRKAIKGKTVQVNLFIFSLISLEPFLKKIN